MTAPFTARYPISDWYQKDQGPIGAQLTKFWLGHLGMEEDPAFFAPKLEQIPDPFTLKDLGAGAEVILEHMARGAKILILGDYDVDGVTATALLLRFFNKLGFTNHLSVIPNRFTEGYGLTGPVASGSWP